MKKLTNDLYWNGQFRVLIFQGESIKLTNAETILIETLVKNINKAVSTEKLFYEIFDYEKEYSVQSIRVLVSKIRKKIPIELIENIYGSEYIIRNTTLDVVVQSDIESHLYDILDQVVDGVVITDPNKEDNPVIFVNKKFLKIYKYKKEDIIGKNCRVLQNKDRDRKEIEMLKNAVDKEEALTVQLINYTKFNQPIDVELTISPIFDKITGKIKFFLGLQRFL